ncbi:MAG: manganese catalase family protein [Negativicutes bacterium]|nr:manganese catalase family protein [Negativicutes bacterium]
MPSKVPGSAKYIACLGDPIADQTEDMAAEQKARVNTSSPPPATCWPRISDASW